MYKTKVCESGVEGDKEDFREVFKVVEMTSDKDAKVNVIQSIGTYYLSDIVAKKAQLEKELADFTLTKQAEIDDLEEQIIAYK